MEFYHDGTLKLERVGQRSFCDQVPPDLIEEVRALLSSPALQHSESSEKIGFDWPEAHIETYGWTVKIVIDEPPTELIPLLNLVDKVFSERFGRRYDMPLQEGK